VLIKDYVPNAADWRVTVAGGGGEKGLADVLAANEANLGRWIWSPDKARLSGYVVRAGDSKAVWLAGHGNDTFQTPVKFFGFVSGITQPGHVGVCIAP